MRIKLQPLISVLIPIYNVELYVKKAVESIQNQTYGNLEIIIVDDGSTDSSLRIVRDISKNDERLKVFSNKKNKKIAKTLNYALSHASGKYIVRMDGDDLSAKDRIEVLLKFIESNPQFDIVGTSMTAISSRGDVLFEKKYSNEPEFIKKSLKYVPPLAHIWIAKKTVYESLNGYRELSGAEDYDFILRAISSGFNVTNISDYYGYNVRINRVGNTADSMGLVQIKLHSYIWTLYKERVFNKKDSFSVTEVDKIINPSRIPALIHKKSNHFLGLAVENKKNLLVSSFYIMLSLMSPYQIIYLKRRLSLYLLIKKFENNKNFRF